MAKYMLNRAMCELTINDARNGFEPKSSYSFSQRPGLHFVAVCLSEYEGVKRGACKVVAFEDGEWVDVVEVAELRASVLDKMARLSDGKVEFYN